MESKIKSFAKRFVWCIPLIIVTIGIFYFINLFERLYTRDLNRQLSEKKQLVTMTEMLSNVQDVKSSILTLDTFDNVYTYLLEDSENTLDNTNKSEIYHSADCPFVLKSHPHDSKEIKNLLLSQKRGSFITKENKKDKIIWEFRHFTVNDKKLLTIIGISNYPKQAVDKELEIAIGLMLFITAILNWILVGFWKYKCSGGCEIKRTK